MNATTNAKMKFGSLTIGFFSSIKKYFNFLVMIIFVIKRQIKTTKKLMPIEIKLAYVFFQKTDIKFLPISTYCIN
jgi:hypothetical protein